MLFVIVAIAAVIMQTFESVLVNNDVYSWVLLVSSVALSIIIIANIIVKNAGAIKNKKSQSDTRG